MQEPARLPFGRDDFDVRVPAVRRSVTSRRAAEHLQAAGVQGKRMAQLLTAYAEVGVPGLAMFEVAARSGLKESSICSLRASAVKRCWLLPMAETRVSPATGVEQAVARITTAGFAALDAWKARQG